MILFNSDIKEIKQLIRALKRKAVIDNKGGGN